MNIMEKFVDKCQEVANAVQARLDGSCRAAQLHEAVDDKDERIQKLTGEVNYWKQKFDTAWSAWHKLALEHHGPAEAAKLAEAMKAGK